MGIVSEPETIFTAALSGLPGNKASIDPPNEPTQQSLLLDLYLLKSGEEKSGSFSTFPCICRLIDCFARAVCIFWNAGDRKILECESFLSAVTINVQKFVQVTAGLRKKEKVGQQGITSTVQGTVSYRYLLHQHFARILKLERAKLPLCP